MKGEAYTCMQWTRSKQSFSRAEEKKRKEIDEALSKSSNAQT